MWVLGDVPWLNRIEYKSPGLQMYKLEFPDTIALKQIWIQAPNQEPALKLHSRAVPSVDAHHHVNGPDTGINSRARRIIKKIQTANFRVLKGLAYQWAKPAPLNIFII